MIAILRKNPKTAWPAIALIVALLLGLGRMISNPFSVKGKRFLRHRTLPSLESPLLCVTFSPDGKKVAAGGWDGWGLWDISSGQLLHKQPEWGHVFSLAFSPDGKTIAVVSTGARLYDVQSKKLLAKDDNGLLPFFSPNGRLQTRFKGAPSPNGKLLAIKQQNTLVLQELKTKKILWTVAGAGQSSMVLGSPGGLPVVFSPDGSMLARGTSGGVIELRDVHTGMLRHSLTVSDQHVYSIAFSPDGKQLAGAGGESNIAKLWESKTGNLVGTVEDDKGAIYAVVFSPDGKTLATASRGDPSTVKLWQLK